MSKLLRWSAAVASSGVLAGLVTAGPALGATPSTAPKVTTGTATSLSATSERLSGTIDDAGRKVEYYFEYGRSAKYGTATPDKPLAAKRGEQRVMATIAHLKANTLYHWTLVVIAAKGSAPKRYAGSDSTFRTGGTGMLMLYAGTLTVTGGRLATPLTCNSTLDCKGKFSVGTRTRDLKTKKLITAVCVSGQPFTIKAHKTLTIRAKILKGCLTLLKHDKHIRAKVTSYPRTGQKALIKTVTVAYRS
jgi:hypothetical protein